MAVSCLELFGVLLLRLVKVLYQTVTNKVIPYHGATTQILSLHPFRAIATAWDLTGISGNVIKWIRSTAGFDPLMIVCVCALQAWTVILHTI